MTYPQKGKFDYGPPFLLYWDVSVVSARGKRWKISLPISAPLLVRYIQLPVRASAPGQQAHIIYLPPTHHGVPTTNTHDNHTRQSSRWRLDENKV